MTGDFDCCVNGDHYRKVSGSPEMSSTHEDAVEMMAARMIPVFRERALELLEDLLDPLAPGYVSPAERDAADDEEDAVFADALEQVRQQLADALPGGAK